MYNIDYLLWFLKYIIIIFNKSDTDFNNVALSRPGKSKVQFDLPRISA